MKLKELKKHLDGLEMLYREKRDAEHCIGDPPLWAPPGYTTVGTYVGVHKRKLGLIKKKIKKIENITIRIGKR